MSSATTAFLLACFLIVAIVLLVELFRTKSRKTVLIQFGMLILVFVLLRYATGFPTVRQAFGGTSPIVTIAIMFVSSVFGIAARYMYFSRKFSWRSFLKPMFVTPIVLLPLISTVQSTGSLESIQVVSLAFLAFQNGFFWKVVLEHAEAKL